MKSSSFLPTPAVKKNLADAVMWTYHGREFPAPTFELGMAPAGCMYSHRARPREVPVVPVRRRQARRQAAPEARDARGDVPPAVRQGRTRSAASASASRSASSRASSGSATAARSTASPPSSPRCPSEKLGVVVVSSRDVSNAVADAHRQRRPAADARGEGRQAAAEDRDERTAAARRGPRARRPLPRRRPVARPDRESFGRLYVESDRGGALRASSASRATDLIADDVQQLGHARFGRDGDTLTIGKTTFTKEKPAAARRPNRPRSGRG